MGDLGQFTVTSGRIRAGDPAFVGDDEPPITWVEFPAKDGVWLAFAHVDEALDPWGRPASLTVRHVDHPTAAPTEVVGNVGVDTASAGFYCAADCPDAMYPYVDEDDVPGVTVASGEGDGTYPCTVARDESGRAIAARLVFLSHPSSSTP